jgi:PAS domain S-box-containing protein
MQKTGFPELKIPGSFLGLAAVIGATYWVADAAWMVFYFKEPSFLKQIFSPQLDDVAMRSSTIALLLVFGAIANRVLAQRRHAESRLKESEARFDLAVRGTEEGIWDWNIRTGEVYLSPRWNGLLGYSDEELPNQFSTWETRIHPDDRDPVLEQLRQHIEERVPYSVEHRLRTKSGAYRWFLTRGQAIWDESGRATRIAGAITDVTERRRTDEAMRHLAAIVECSDDAILSSTTTGEFLSWNAGAEHLFGYSADEILGKPVSMLVPADRADEVSIILGRVRGGETVFHHETVRLHKDGSRIDVSLTISPMRDASGRVVSVSAVAQDISEHKRAERRLAKAKSDAEAANRAKSEFLANMSHEIRTPMAVILGYSDLMAGEETSPDRVQRLEIIKRNGRHLLQLLDDLLDLSKIEAERLAVDRVPFSPTQVLSEVRSFMAMRAREKGLDLEIERVGVVPDAIEGDPMRLRQVLINLVGNAIKFTDTGTVRLVSCVVGSPGSERLCLEVIDTGIGMTKDQISEVFKPFLQVDGSATRRFGGTGLGLSISRRLCELMGGTIEVDSEPGAGATFRVLLPIQKGTTAASKEISPEPAVIPRSDTVSPGEIGPSFLEGYRVLLVEDHADTRGMIGDLLRRAGAEVSIAENGQVAVELAMDRREKGSHFSMVLMDMQLPVLDGYEATRVLRRLGYGAPIIALTAYATPSEMERCLEAGCNEALGKPVEPSRLLNFVSRWASRDGGTSPNR